MATSQINERGKGTRQYDKLTVQQKSFVKFLLADPAFDLTEAARLSGYHSPTAAGKRLIKNPVIAALTGNEIRKRNERLELSADSVLMRLRTLLEADVTELLDEDGKCSMERIKALPAVIRQCITKIKCCKKYITDDEGNRSYYDDLEIEWMSKDQALQLAMRHFGLLTPEINVTLVSDDVKRLVISELLHRISDSQKVSVVDGEVIERLARQG
jgi:hypothetical protein